MYARKTSNGLYFSFYSRKTHFLERFYVFLKKSSFFAQNCQFWLILEVKKSKNRSKNGVFDFFDLKIGFLLRKPVFKSYAIYKKLIPLKIRKLHRF